MASFEMESKLAEEYANELQEIINSLFESSESLSIQGKLRQKLQVFEKHLNEMQRDFAEHSEELGFWKGLIHDVRGLEQLAAHGLVDGTINRAAKTGASSNDTGEVMAGMVFALLAGNRNKKKASDATPYFSKAIEVFPAYRFYWHRALSYEMSDRYQEALEDLAVLTESDNAYYIDARKLKNEILQKQEKAQEKDRCFIATSVYGSIEADEVLVLRDFRDSRLLSKPMGRRFVETYYKFSPVIARLLDRVEFLRTVVRLVLLNPMVAVIKQWPKED